MKPKSVILIKKVLSLLLVLTMAFSITATGYAAEENVWNKGKKVNYIPSSGAISYEPSSGAKNLADLYQLKWYDNPTRDVLKGEFILVQLRTIQASLERRNLTTLTAPNETLKYKDINTLTKAAQEEAKILKSLGILTGSSDGYMKLNVPITRSEAAEVLAVTNSKILNIPSLRTTKMFEDTKGHRSEKSVDIAYQTYLMNAAAKTLFRPNASVTIEQTLQILENEVGYFGITRADVAKAMNETFKVTLDISSSNNMVTKNSYKKYEEKMKIYGFDQLYDNKSAKTSETVTKSEVIKLALGAIYNATSEYDFGPLQDGFGMPNNEYPNANWVDYAKSKKLLNEDINLTNYNEKAKYIDAITLFEQCKAEILKEYPEKDSKTYLKDIENYSSEEQAAVKDMLENGIIYPVADILKGNEYIFKGQLNELVVNFADRYSTIALGEGKVVADPAKMPSNAYMYAYILSNVDNSVYEKETLEKLNLSFTAKDMYSQKKALYLLLKQYVEGAYNRMLNVDYNTVTEENLLEGVENYFIFKPDAKRIKYYVNYLKKYKIILKGNCELQLPIIYYANYTYRARVKLTFEVVNSKTKENLLFLDSYSAYTMTYQKSRYTIFADIPLDIKFEDPTLFLDNCELYPSILDKEKSGIVTK